MNRKALWQRSKANTALMWAFLQARMMMPRESDLATLAQTTVSFSMVRHPFERIVSAYEDKVMWSSSMYLNMFQTKREFCPDSELERFGECVAVREDHLHHPVWGHLLQLLCQNAHRWQSEGDFHRGDVLLNIQNTLLNLKMVITQNAKSPPCFWGSWC